jgi:hypothetical protein
MIPAAGICWSGLRPAPRGGFAPATPSRTKTKTFPRKEKQESFCALPLVGTEQNVSQGDRTTLALTGGGAVKQFHVLDAASLAAFEVITDGRI